jgi:methylglutaconyl-CoA hydratase
MTYEHIRYGSTGSAAWITLSRPDRLNLISTEVFVELADAFTRARLDPHRDVIVLGASGAVFSAGGDLAAGIAARVAEGPSADLTSEMYRHVHDDYLAFNAIESCPKTVICALNGPAYGAGAVLALLCDLIVASPEASVSFAAGRWGLVDAPSAARLAQRVGVTVAKDLLYTGRSVGAEEARRIGLINRVAATRSLLAEVADYIDEVRSVAPSVRTALKAIMGRTFPPMAIDEHFRSAVGPEFFEGAAAFASGRPAPWTGAAERLRATEAMLAAQANASAREQWLAGEQARKAARSNGTAPAPAPTAAP